MIQYLNANQGFVMAVLTAVYVFATLVLVVVAQRQASLARKSLDFASASERAKFRPYVISDIIYEDSVAYARLRNSGASPAIDVRVTVAPRLRWKDREEGVGIIEKAYYFWPPRVNFLSRFLSPKSSSSFIPTSSLEEVSHIAIPKDVIIPNASQSISHT